MAITRRGAQILGLLREAGPAGVTERELGDATAARSGTRNDGRFTQGARTALRALARQGAAERACPGCGAGRGEHDTASPRCTYPEDEGGWYAIVRWRAIR